MSLIHRTPAAELDEIRRNLTQTFFEPFRTVGDEFLPAADVIETIESYQVTLDVPGFTKDEIRIQLKSGLLSIEGKKEVASKEEGQRLGRERIRTRFTRSFDFGEAVDPDRVSARVSEGVLVVTIGKPESVKPRFIEIGN